MTTTATKRRTTESASGPSSGETGAEIDPVVIAAQINRELASHSGLVEAREKLKSIESQAATLRAELDQTVAATDSPDLEELAGRILHGDDLHSVDAVIQRRDILRQKVQAFDLAVAKQKNVVERQLRHASALIAESLAPIHRQAVDNLMAAFQGYKAAIDGLGAVYSGMVRTQVPSHNSLPFFDLPGLSRLWLQLEYNRVTYWEPWLKGQDCK